MDTKILDTYEDNTYEEALFGWGKPSETVRLGQKIRIHRKGLNPKTGYAYKEDGMWLGIRYTWKSHRWWSLLNYNNPLIKLEVQELDNEGKYYWITIWEKGQGQ